MMTDPGDSLLRVLRAVTGRRALALLEPGRKQWSRGEPT